MRGDCCGPSQASTGQDPPTTSSGTRDRHLKFDVSAPHWNVAAFANGTSVHVLSLTRKVEFAVEDDRLSECYAVLCQLMGLPGQGVSFRITTTFWETLGGCRHRRRLLRIQRSPCSLSIDCSQRSTRQLRKIMTSQSPVCEKATDITHCYEYMKGERQRACSNTRWTVPLGARIRWRHR
jgi:hypothetical protein